MEKQGGSVLKRRDAALLILIVIAAAVIGTAMWFMRNSKQADKVTIKVDGNVIYSEALSRDNEINVDGFDGGHNTVVIKGGKVSVTDADCPDKVCMNTGEIDSVGQTIVCMPHRVVVEIEGSAQEVDSVVK